MKFYPLLVFVALTACGIESVQQDIRLKPPLGLTAQNLSNNILLSFWSLNNETYFDGFKIYVTMDSNTAVINEGNGGDVISNIYDDPTYPTITINNVQPVSSPTNISLFIAERYNFTNNQLYYLYVKSYSSSYTVPSKSSEIVSITYLTN